MMRYLSKVAVALIAVGVAYGVSSALGINHFAWTLLKGRYYQYVSIFLPLLAVWGCIYLFSHLAGKQGFTHATLAGLVGGYVCGLLTFLLLPIYGSNSVRRIFTTRDWGDSIIFLSPVIALSWFIGLIAAWV